MNRCGTCQFFGEVVERYDSETCEDVATTYHTCNEVKMRDSDSESEGFAPGLTAMAVDGSWYYAALIVEEDFGCVSWREKEDG